MTRTRDGITIQEGLDGLWRVIAIDGVPVKTGEIHTTQRAAWAEGRRRRPKEVERMDATDKSDEAVHFAASAPGSFPVCWQTRGWPTTVRRSTAEWMRVTCPGCLAVRHKEVER